MSGPVEKKYILSTITSDGQAKFVGYDEEAGCCFLTVNTTKISSVNDPASAIRQASYDTGILAANFLVWELL